MTEALCFSSVNKRWVFNGKGGRVSRRVSSTVAHEVVTETLSDSLCFCQPASVSVFCLHLPFPHSSLFVALNLSNAVTHAHPILITHPPTRDYFHWPIMKWPSDHTQSGHTHTHLASSPPLRGRCFLSIFRWNVGRDRERQIIALKGKTTPFHNSHLHFPQGQDSLISLCDEWIPQRWDTFFNLWFLAEWLDLELIDYLTGWIIDWLIKCVIAWLVGWMTDCSERLSQNKITLTNLPFLVQFNLFAACRVHLLDICPD